MSGPTLGLVTTGPEDTRNLAGRLAPLLQPGDVLSLTGELGAGKTCFVQGVAAALGVEQPVTSPTFLLVRVYDEARLPLVHVDVYRLNRLHEVYDLGEDVLRPDGVTVIEWGDAIAPLLPPDRLEIELLHRGDDGDGRRTLRVVPLGSWCDRLPELQGCVADWTAGG